MARKAYPSDHRRWFRLAEDILDDRRLVGLGNDGLAAWTRLLALLNRRKSRDGKIALDPIALQAMCGKRRRDVALTLARRLADVGLTSMRLDGDVTEIIVSKWPEWQGFAPTKLRRDSGETPSPTPTPTHTPIREEKRRSDVPSPKPANAAPSGTAKRGTTDPPERLTDEQRQALDAWCAAKHPNKLPRVRDLEEACLDYFRSRGKRHRDWLATVRTWVRNERASLDPRKQDPDEIDRQAVALIRARREQREQRNAPISGPPADVRRLQPALPTGAARDVRGGHWDA